MHIEIEFLGDIAQRSEQYISVLEDIENWQKLTEIAVKMTYNDPVLTVFLASREDYSIWVLTYRSYYKIVNFGWEE